MSLPQTLPRDEVPSGLPDGAPEPDPLGVPEADPDRDAPAQPSEDDLPGIVGDDESPPDAG